METKNEFDPREQRAVALLRDKRTSIRRIVRQVFYIPSQTHSGGYVVDLTAQSCTCPDFGTWGATGHHRCKHIRCAALHVRMPDGSEIIVATKHGKRTTGTRGKRTPETRDWGIYNPMAVDRHRAIPKLLYEVVQSISVPERPPSKRGAKPVDPRDVIYCGGLKMLYQESARNLGAMMDLALANGFIRKGFHYTTLQRDLADPCLTPLIRQGIDIAAAPLVSVEDKIIFDATGFSTCNYRRWFDEKYPGKKKDGSEKQEGSEKEDGSKRERKSRLWIKLHAATGFRTKVMMAARVTERYVTDGSMMPYLLDDALANGFRPHEGLADAAYLDQKLIRKLLENLITPYIDFRSNTTGVSSQELRDLFKTFKDNEKKYMEHYNKRSIGETAFWMLKQNFGQALFAKGVLDDDGNVVDASAQYNEAYLKVLMHNCWCLVNARHEIGLDPHPTSPGGMSPSNDTAPVNPSGRSGTRELDFGGEPCDALELSA